MRRWMAVVGVLATVSAGCGPSAGAVGHGRRSSWQRISDPAFTAGPSFGIAGVAAPADGYPRWTAAGSVRTAGGDFGAAVWTAADGTRWGRVDLDMGGGREGEATGVAARQGRAIAVGNAVMPTGDREPRVWSSRDGSTWIAVPLTGGPGDQSMARVAAGPLGYLAAGTDRSMPALWWSADGDGWKRAEGPLGPDQAISAVAVGKAGMVAVGTIQTSGDVDGMAWFSADGSAWRTVDLGSAGFSGPAAQHVLGVTASADGGFVAVGDDGNADRRFAVVWTSADGITWQRQSPSPDMGEVPGLASTAGLGAEAVAGTGPFVAVGGGYAEQVWTSPDGRRWTRDESPVRTGTHAGSDQVATDGRSQLVFVGGRGLFFRPAGGGWAAVGTDANVFPTADRSFAINALVRAGGRLLAFGSANGPDGYTGAALWTSYDGRQWERQADQGHAFGTGTVAGVTTLGSLLVAAGTDTDPTTGGNVAAVWTSGDGGWTWARVGEGTPGFAIEHATQIFGIGTGGPGVVAVGLGYDGKHIVAHAWSSADGRTWRRAVDPPEWGGAGDHYLDVACGLPGGSALILGKATVRGKRDVMAWTSTDGVTWQQASAGTSGAAPLFVTSCLATPEGVLLGGGVSGAGGTDSALWSTVDGGTWTALPGSGTLAGPADDWVRDLAGDGSRLVATTREGGQVAVSTSVDAGRTWRRRSGAGMGGLGSRSTSNVVVVGDELVVAGTDGSSAAVWIGPAP